VDCATQDDEDHKQAKLILEKLASEMANGGMEFTSEKHMCDPP